MDKKNNHEFRVRASTITIHENKLLVVKLRDPHSGVLHWYPPGGKIEPNENPLLAAERETLEETGVLVKADPKSELVVDYPFVWNAMNYQVKTYFYRAEVVRLPADKKVRDDAVYNLGWGWLEPKAWPMELGFCEAILSSVYKLSSLPTM